MTDMHANFDLLTPKPSGLMLEVTSKCNLRCVYCTKSQAGNDQVPGRNEDMIQTVIDGTSNLIAESAFSELLLSGTGETTFHPAWQSIVKEFRHKGKTKNPNAAVTINSNFAKDYSESEMETLLTIDTVIVSIDTVDAETTKTMRRKSSIEKILYNVSKLAALASVRGVRRPRIMVNCTLTNRVHKDVKKLFFTLAEYPVDMITFSDVVELSDLAQLHRFSKVSYVPREEFLTFAKDLHQCIQISRNAKDKKYPQIFVQESLVNMLNERLKNPDMIPEEHEETTIAEGETRLCMQPWTRYTIGANGEVFPCCVTEMPPLTTIQKDPNPFYSEAAQAFRQGLLKGGEHTPKPCRGCSNAAIGKIGTLIERINSLHKV